MAKRRVVVKGGGANLYYISEYAGRFYVTQRKVGLITDTNIDIGKTRTLDDALSLIRSHSGRGIDSIS